MAWRIDLENRLGAYNGVLVGSSLSIGYLTQGGWNGVRKVAFDGAIAAVSRFITEYSWAQFNEPIRPAWKKMSNIALQSVLKSVDSLASATSDFLPRFAKGELGQLLVSAFDAGISSLWQDSFKSPRPSNDQRIENSAAAVALAGSVILFKSAWNNNPQTNGTISDKVADETFNAFSKVFFSVAIGWGSKGLGGFLNFFRDLY